MRALIFYFSLGGTTRTVVEEVASAMRDKGHETDLCSIGDAAPDVNEYDALGIGSPAHFFRPPEPVREFIEQMPRIDGKPFFTMVLHGTVIGDAGNFVRKWLVEKGGEDAGYFSTRGKDLWLGYLRRGRLFSPDRPHSDDLEAARTFADKVADRIESGKYTAKERYDPTDPSPGLVYRVERMTIHPWVVKNLYTRMFKATDVCIGCGDCVEACPKENVSLAADMRPVWGKECIFCLNCELACPEDAVRSAADSTMMAPFMRYNVNRALADPNIESAPVEFQGGTARRLD